MDEEINTMTADELQAEIDRLRSELGDDSGGGRGRASPDLAEFEAPLPMSRPSASPSSGSASMTPSSSFARPAPSGLAPLSSPAATSRGGGGGGASKGAKARGAAQYIDDDS